MADTPPPRDDADEDAPRGSGAIAHPDHPGWFYWPGVAPDSFAGRTGLILFRPDGPGRGRTRMFPDDTMLNMGGSIHGGAAMSFIDMSLFAGGRCGGMAAGHYVTLDCSTTFVSRGQAGVPLDAFVTLVGETRGGMVFLNGHCEQDGRVTHRFNGTLKRIKPRQP